MNFFSCPVCDRPIPTQEIERHVNGHFEDDEINRDMELAHQISLAPPSAPRIDNSISMDFQFEPAFGEAPESSSSQDDRKSSEDQPIDIDVQICYVISLQSRAIFHRIEGGLISLLKKCLEHGNSRSLLCGYVDHFQSTRSEDMGWGCGWRNIQMITSHLLRERPEAREVLFGGAGFVPDIGSLQRWLEIAWQRGFDTVGSIHFKGKIYGSRKWIGTTECAGLLRSFGLRANIVDFDKKAGKGNVVRVYGPMDKFVVRKEPQAVEGVVDHGKDSAPDNKDYQVLIDWIWRYFSKDEPKEFRHRVVVTDKMPLYFQHHGHSRTIIGIQLKHQKNGLKNYNLLVLDPGHRTEDLERSLKVGSGWQKFLKRGVHTLRRPQYQLCYVDPGIVRTEEMEQLKTLNSDLLKA